MYIVYKDINKFVTYVCLVAFWLKACEQVKKITNIK